jgi:NAD-dependent DNA ligase
MKKLGFKQALTYILDVCCYAYYVKDDELVSDQVFDALEKLYCKMFEEKCAPNRAEENEKVYT